jgi:hypothetical protein
MTDTKKQYTVSISDYIETSDSLGWKQRDDNSVRPKGKVEIYQVLPDGNKKLVSTSNLVVYVGRSLICEKILDLENSQNTTTKSEFISWLSVGSGGCTQGDPLAPIPPTLTDVGLANEVPIASSGTTLADLRGGKYYKAPFDEVIFERDPLNDDEYLIAKIVTTIRSDWCNEYNINEVALWSSTSRDAGHSGPFHLYARSTFPTLVKDALGIIQFVWYLFF